MCVASESILVDGYVIRYEEGEPASDGQRKLRVVYDLDCENPQSTAAITKHEGRRFWTADGKEYVLGTPHQIFRDWLRDKGLSWDDDNPLDFDRSAAVLPVMGPDEDRDNPYWSLFNPE